ncbi:MAG: AMP-binding protein, partial [Sphingobacteriales bacterium]
MAALSVGVRLFREKGDRIGIYSPNCYEWMVVQYAASLAGLILVNINPAYQTSELKYALNKVGCKGIITASKFKSSNYIEILNEILPELKTSRPNELSSKNVPGLKLLVRIDDEQTPGFLNFKELFDMPGADDFRKLGQIENSLSPEDAANIQFTSGTTGNPKGATLSHTNILNNGDGLARRIGYSDKDSIALGVPLYHCFGMV